MVTHHWITDYSIAQTQHDMSLCGIFHREVTKFEFKFDNVQTSNVFNRFEIGGVF